MYAEIEMGSGVRCDAQSIASTNTEKLQERKAAQGVQRTWRCFAARVVDTATQLHDREEKGISLQRANGIMSIYPWHDIDPLSFGEDGKIVGGAARTRTKSVEERGIYVYSGHDEARDGRVPTMVLSMQHRCPIRKSNPDGWSRARMGGASRSVDLVFWDGAPYRKSPCWVRVKKGSIERNRSRRPWCSRAGQVSDTVRAPPRHATATPDTMLTSDGRPYEDSVPAGRHCMLLDAPTPSPPPLCIAAYHNASRPARTIPRLRTHIMAVRTSYAQRGRNVSLIYAIAGPAGGAGRGRRAVLPLFWCPRCESAIVMGEGRLSGRAECCTRSVHAKLRSQTTMADIRRRRGFCKAHNDGGSTVHKCSSKENLSQQEDDPSRWYKSAEMNKNSAGDRLVGQTGIKTRIGRKGAE
ncbi:predicted protein [Postia placenta Mad-698-R]|uniref:Uncharacterized protein n=1 Tax=Postia placenta MAD-698-R-SB12 TaxID=670580 RepID=A0A1X6NAM3_9APHY|nr:hypothetical protein POSPLADRAFT_1043330 [Postia placenta MAD-698-R-SB12]EED82049.1 predicted protein [Postia placenta Mad-698-R]OSX65698.1 hypothetical protein POSPLADRAFT_1043330 [Postia placenta MAD-698-R-SB12]